LTDCTNRLTWPSPPTYCSEGRLRYSARPYQLRSSFVCCNRSCCLEQSLAIKSCDTFPQPRLSSNTSKLNCFISHMCLHLDTCFLLVFIVLKFPLLKFFYILFYFCDLIHSFYVYCWAPPSTPCSLGDAILINLDRLIEWCWGQAGRIVRTTNAKRAACELSAFCGQWQRHRVGMVGRQNVHHVCRKSTLLQWTHQHLAVYIGTRTSIIIAGRTRDIRTHLISG